MAAHNEAIMRSMRWFAKRLRRRLSEGTYLLLTDERGKAQAAVIALPSDAQRSVMRHLEMAAGVGSCGHGGAVSAFLADVLAATSPLIAGSLQAGQLLQVVGTPRLLEGLATGAYSIVQSSGGIVDALEGAEWEHPSSGDGLRRPPLTMSAISVVATLQPFGGTP